MSNLHVKELKRAARRIKNKESHYICDALCLPNFKYDGSSPWSKSALKIKKKIDLDLEGCWSLDIWLRDKYGVVFKEECDENHDLLRATRLAWIDALIEYWSDKP